MSQSLLYAAARTSFGRILGTLAHVRCERWGVGAICNGVGHGLAMVLENLGAVR